MLPKFEIKNDDGMVTLYYEGKEVFRWNNDANVEYPEDLTWGRMIGGVFYDGYRLGLKHGKEEK